MRSMWTKAEGSQDCFKQIYFQSKGLDLFMDANEKDEKNRGQTVCSHCGCVLTEDALICPKCGKEIVQISPTDILEEEFLQEIVDEENHSVEEGPAGPGSLDEVTVSDEAFQNGMTRRQRNLIIGIIIAAAIVVVIVSVLVYQNRSTNYLLRRAQREYNQRDYDDALEYLDKLFARDSENEAGLILEGEVYTALGEYDTAEEAFFAAIAINPDSVEAYEGLLKLYAMQGKTAEIIALKQSVTNEEILALFDDYLIPAPEILTEGGTFEDSFTVELKTNYKGAVIYYTLDGTTPTDRSTRYTEPIRISEEGSTVLTAVIMDEEGNYSEPVSETYVLEYPVPENPLPDPIGGEFSSETTIEVTVPDNAVVYYTWDNKTPTENSTLYTEPIPIPEGNNVLSIHAIKERGKQSEVGRYNYIYYPATTSQTIENNETEETRSTESTGTINGIQPQVTTPEPSTETTEEPTTDNTSSSETTPPEETEEPVVEEPETTEPDTYEEEHDE